MDVRPAHMNLEVRLAFDVGRRMQAGNDAGGALHETRQLNSPASTRLGMPNVPEYGHNLHGQQHPCKRHCKISVFDREHGVEGPLEVTRTKVKKIYVFFFVAIMTILSFLSFRAIRHLPKIVKIY